MTPADAVRQAEMLNDRQRSDLMWLFKFHVSPKSVFAQGKHENPTFNALARRGLAEQDVHPERGAGWRLTDDGADVAQVIVAQEPDVYRGRNFKSDFEQWLAKRAANILDK